MLFRTARLIPRSLVRSQQRLNFTPTVTRRFTHYNASLAGLSPSEAEFRETVWDFAERVVGPVAEEIDLTGGKSTEILLDVHRKTGQMGLLGITVPTEGKYLQLQLVIVTNSKLRKYLIPWTLPRIPSPSPHNGSHVLLLWVHRSFLRRAQ